MLVASQIVQWAAAFQEDCPFIEAHILALRGAGFSLLLVMRTGSS